MKTVVSEEKIKELTAPAQSQKLIPEEKLLFDGVDGDYTYQQKIATTAFMILRRIGVNIQVEFDD